VNCRWSASQKLFGTRCHTGLRSAKDLQRIGVVNQTTMLATETQAIADHLKQVMIQKYGDADLKGPLRGHA
jgi:4-hydroxy-3-methylbut-2-enyl diphosphate reductase